MKALRVGLLRLARRANVAVVVVVDPVAEVAVAQLVAEECDDAVLGDPFGLADKGHSKTSQ